MSAPDAETSPETVDPGASDHPRAAVDQPRTYTVDQVACLAGVSRRVMYEAVARGEVPGTIRLGKRRILLARAAIDRWLDGAGGAGTAEEELTGASPTNRKLEETAEWKLSPNS